MTSTVVSPTGTSATDPRLILREEELDAALETLLLAEASLWMVADEVLATEPSCTGPAAAGPTLGRGHFRAALLLKRRPGLGVQDLARLTGLSKQGASRVLKDLVNAGHAAPVAEGDADGRRRPMTLTAKGAAFEDRVASRMRARLARAYRDGGLEAVPGARRIFAALAGTRNLRASEPSGEAV